MGDSALYRPRWAWEAVDTETEAQAWAQVANNLAMRDALIIQYLPFADMVAATQYTLRSRNEVDFDDYRQLAREGLMQAVARFDPARGVPFVAYGKTRIVGMIRDGVNGYSDRAGQSALHARLNARVNALANERQAPDALERLVEVAVGLAIGLLLESGQNQIEERSHEPTPYERLELKQLAIQVNRAVNALTPVQKNIVVSHYYGNQCFTDIAERMQLSRARVSQAHAGALRRLYQLVSSPSQGSV